jgi:hypothetical protein
VIRRINVVYPALPASDPKALPEFLRELAAAVDAAAIPGSESVTWLCIAGNPVCAIVPLDVAQAAERHYAEQADSAAYERSREAGRE